MNIFKKYWKEFMWEIIRFLFFKKKDFYVKRLDKILVRQLVTYVKLNLFNMIKIIMKSETIVTIQENIKELHIQYTIDAILVMAHKASADDNHLILTEISKRCKNWLFLCCWKLKNLSVFQLEKFLKKLPKSLFGEIYW